MKRYLFLFLTALFSGHVYAQSYTSVHTQTFDVMGPQNITFYTFQPGVNYKLVMSGTWGDFSGVASYDTRYSMGNGQDFGYNYFIAAPAWLKNLTPTPAGYNLATHTYSLYFTGDGSTAAFTYTDSGYSDNTGVVKFELFRECASVNLSLGKDTSVCGTPALTLTASGGTTYTWYNAASGGSVISTGAALTIPAIQQTDTFFVSTTLSNGCESNRDTVIVMVNPVPVITFSTVSLICTDDAPISLNGSPAGGVYSGSGISGMEFDPAAAGTGSVTLTYSYTSPQGCLASGSQVISVDACTGLSADTPALIPRLFPNPAKTILHITFPGKELLTSQIYDSQGRLVQSCKGSSSLEISGLLPGIYFIELESADGQIARRRFIKD